MICIMVFHVSCNSNPEFQERNRINIKITIKQKNEENRENSQCRAP